MTIPQLATLNMMCPVDCSGPRRRARGLGSTAGRGGADRDHTWSGSRSLGPARRRYARGVGVRGLPAGFPASALASTAWVVQTTRQTHRPPTKKVSLQGGEQEQGQALRAQSRTTSSARALRAHQPRGPIPHAKIFENYTKNSRDLRAGFGPGSGRARAGFGPGSGRVPPGYITHDQPIFLTHAY